MTPGPRAPVLAVEDLPAPPRQARSVEKRRELMDAGRVLFGEKGYDATSIGDITSTARTAAGAFYRYFRSKRQLLVVLMNELIQRLGGVDLKPAGAVNARAGLRRFLADVFRADREYYGVIRAWQEAALKDVELAGMQAAIAGWTEARILRVFQGMQEYPNARAAADLPSFARMMDRHCWSLLARGASMGQREFERDVTITADVIYHYLFRDDADPTRARRKTLKGRDKAGSGHPPSGFEHLS